MFFSSSAVRNQSMKVVSLPYARHPDAGLANVGPYSAASNWFSALYRSTPPGLKPTRLCATRAIQMVRSRGAAVCSTNAAEREGRLTASYVHW